MRRVTAVSVLLLVLYVQHADACSCARSSSFSAVVAKAPLVVVAEVIGYDGYAMELGICEVLRGIPPPRLLVEGDHGMSCLPYAKSFPIGTLWVFALSPYQQDQRFTFPWCAAAWGEIWADRVIGFLSESYTVNFQEATLGEIRSLVRDGVPLKVRSAEDVIAIAGTDGVTAPRIKERVEPQFDPDCILRHESVEVSFTVDETGRIRRQALGQQLESCEYAAVAAAVAKWKFEPATRDGIPVAARFMTTIALPYQPPAARCERKPFGRGLRPVRPVVIARDGEKSTITFERRRADLEILKKFAAGRGGFAFSRPGAMVALLDLYSAPWVTHYDKGWCGDEPNPKSMTEIRKTSSLPGRCFARPPLPSGCEPFFWAANRSYDVAYPLPEKELIQMTIRGAAFELPLEVLRQIRGRGEDIAIIFLTRQGRVERKGDRAVRFGLRKALPRRVESNFPAAYERMVDNECHSPVTTYLELNETMGSCGCFEVHLFPLQQLESAGVDWWKMGERFDVFLTRLRVAFDEEPAAALEFEMRRPDYFFEYTQFAVFDELEGNCRNDLWGDAENNLSELTGSK